MEPWGRGSDGIGSDPGTGGALPPIPPGQVPYLGPIPPPGRSFEPVVIAVSVALAALWVVRAAVLLQLSSVERRFLTDGATLAEVESATDLSALLALSGWPSIIASVVALSMWRSRRRPKDVVQSHGEAYVEAPAKIYLTVPWRIAMGAAIAVYLLGFGVMGSVNRSTKLAEVPDKRLGAAVGLLGLAVAFGLEAWSVRMANRHTEARLAWSTPYRAAPGSVPYVAPVASGGAFESSSSDRSEGIGWIFTTLGLALVAIVGLVFGIGGFVQLFGPKDQAAGALFFAIGASMVGFVVWRVVVRRRRKAAARGVPSPGAGGFYGHTAGEGWSPPSTPPPPSPPPQGPPGGPFRGDPPRW